MLRATRLLVAVGFLIAGGCSSPVEPAAGAADLGVDGASTPDASQDAGDTDSGDARDAEVLDGGGGDAAVSTSIALGAWIPGAPGDASAIDAYAIRVGTAPAVVHWYQSWARFADFPTTSLDTVIAHDAMPLLTWEPWDTSAGVTQPAYALRAIVAGDHDVYIRRWRGQPRRGARLSTCASRTR